MLHAYGDFIVHIEVAIETNNVGRFTLLEYVQLPHDTIAYRRLDIQQDHLRNIEHGMQLSLNC